eukprot:766748-Hanusia_phi.AAC.9
MYPVKLTMLGLPKLLPRMETVAKPELGPSCGSTCAMDRDVSEMISTCSHWNGPIRISKGTCRSPSKLVPWNTNVSLPSVRRVWEASVAEARQGNS